MFFTIAAVMVVNSIFYVVVMNRMQFGMISRVGTENKAPDEKELPAFGRSTDRHSVN
jgi:hypothetical protein